MRRLSLLVLGLALLAGCGESDSSGPAESSLTGVPWQVSAGLHTSGWEAVAPSITFTDGHASGSTGCNRFNASYKISGGKLTLGPVATTSMACAAPADAVETEFLAALDAVGTWHIDGDELVLGDEHGAELLRLREASPAGAWVATAFLQADAVKSALLGTEITAEFAADGTLTGSAGCNTYHATYTHDGAALRIAAPTAGRAHCETPAGIMEQEQAYLAALPLTRSYEVDGELLKLLTGKGTIVATYTRSS